MRVTQYFFSYGSLQLEDVQHEVLERTLEGKPDVLSGYRISEQMVSIKYKMIEPSSNYLDEVSGVLFKVSNYELHKIDEYETCAYKRVQVQLKSGVKAWTYIKNLV